MNVMWKRNLAMLVDSDGDDSARAEGDSEARVIPPAMILMHELFHARRGQYGESQNLLSCGKADLDKAHANKEEAAAWEYERKLIAWLAEKYRPVPGQAVRDEDIAKTKYAMRKSYLGDGYMEGDDRVSGKYVEHARVNRPDADKHGVVKQQPSASSRAHRLVKGTGGVWGSGYERKQ